jgi:anti-sigma regulatory factor (Ser/Thr protein kinase)
VVEPTSSRGRGLRLIYDLTDSVHITTEAAGTTVRMIPGSGWPARDAGRPLPAF